ncbi:phospholipase B1, membrane-associated [Perca flavescens]|uniref:phospholipase B1, membrane-associated n=1 Tax=Perca flavescens TaxID=8167 RepID=UPI00106E82A6|nr:phospholipase B1, membrane-associated-like [Perca flavescens]
MVILSKQIIFMHIIGLPCTQMFPSQSAPSNVNSVTPSDVAVLSSIGLHMHSTELSMVVSRLTELMTLFNPGLISPLSDETNLYAPQFVQHSTLVEQAKEVSIYLQNNQAVDVDRDWKLVLLFAQVDQLCACEQQQQVQSVIKAVVEEVDDALQLLHSQLKRTIVSVALWDGERGSFHPKMCRCTETNNEGEDRLQKAMLSHALQESLDELMVKKHWYHDRDDFTVIVQDAPFITDLSSVSSGKHPSKSASPETDKLMVQMWTNLLQHTSDQNNTEDNGKIIALPCPTEDRPFLRTEGNSPSYHHSDASPLLLPFTGTEMPCEDLSPSPSTPTSVHELRPGDIKVVAAVGDSLTAGNGIASSPNNILDVLSQYRGLSWSIGGDENLTTVTTLPNILKHFNHNLTGYSVGKGKEQTPQAFLNQAVAGAKSKNIPTQVRALVARMKNDPRINFELDWKVITLFIGGNDICDHCYNSLLYSEENYIRNVRDSLDYLHKERLLHELVESGRYDTRSDFTVVVQPFFRRIVVPRLPDGRADRSFFSADCFHLSQKAQTLMARSLWNNMLEPLGNKTTIQNFTVDLDLKCPTKNWGSDFSCVDIAPSDTVPTSVHKLRPADIKVVAALGDSTTAGTGAKAKNLFDLNKEYKGVSWSIGGDETLETVTTLPNILKKFNPFIKGFSRGQGSRHKFFNMAVPGAKSSDIALQVQALIKAIKENKEVNFEKDWKIVTIFVGGNDLCNYCIDQNNLSPKNYSHNLMLSLDMLYKEAEIEHLISGNRYEGKEDVAVVLQPFLHNSFIPYIGEGEVDSSFFSVDCFHISERAHAEMAIALWNNMLEPVGRKQNYNNFTYDRSKIHCPSEANPFIFTKINSLPGPPVTTTSPAPTIPVPKCPSSMPVWVPVIVGIRGDIPRPQSQPLPPGSGPLRPLTFTGSTPNPSGSSHRWMCRCTETHNEGEDRLQTAMLSHALQSLDELMVKKHWYHDRDDFTVIVQDAPFITDLSSVSFTGTEMPCEDLSPSPSTPTSVHELRPGDIKVVAAVGDSLTAGNGIASSPNNVLDVLSQYRGLSWSIGGDENLTTVTTLPNILKHFNHNLTGYSVGKGKEQTPQAFLNQAVAGAKSKDIPTQVQALVARMKNDSRINFELDWKVITLFIGGNDICDHCYNSLLYSEENYIRNVRDSLDYLHKEMPRALVNLVEPLHIIPLREMHSDTSLKCPTWLLNILCPCVILPMPNSEALQKVEDINRNYQRLLHELVESGRYDTRSDFTVVVQPFFRRIVVPRLPDGRADRSFFSADCFHLSQKAQTLMARSLWNNMLEPLGNKTTIQNFTVDLDLKCPTKTSPFIRTYNNSNYIYGGPSPTPGPITNWGSDFSCVDIAPSDTVPTSVHKLRPADIKVVAALGDSTTAGTGAKAKNLFDLNKEYKGVSWSIGGDETLETVTTLPNILKKFNPFIKGFSRGQGSRQKFFNMAVPGAKSSDIALQVQALIKAIKENKEVNFEKDWKIVTIFVGGNDLCNYCIDQNNLSPKNYSHNLMLSLDMLYKEVPRLLVNVVAILQIDPLKSVMRNTLGCSLLQRTSCPCVINPAVNSPELEKIKQINREYQAEIEHLISGNRYEGKEDVAVVLQPFLHNSFIPYIGEGEVDSSFFSVDCFHISKRAHAEMAIALWNNMLEPVGRKQNYNNFTYDRSKIHCPSEANPFIFTKINSLPGPPVTTTSPVPKCPSSMPASSTSA